jgi:hypothetical protein
LSGGWLAAYTDSDSDWSSLERRKLAAEMYRGGGVGVSVGTGRKPTPHKRTRKKRAAIPVATPRVPPFGDAASAMLSYRFKEDKGAFSAMSFLEIFPPVSVGMTSSGMAFLFIIQHHHWQTENLYV